MGIGVGHPNSCRCGNSTTAVLIGAISSSMELSWPVGFWWFAFTNQKCRQRTHKFGPLVTSLWRHNGHNGVSNHQPHDCLLNRLFRPRSKKTSKLRITGLCAGNSPGTFEFPPQMAINAENVSIWWRHHGLHQISVLMTPNGLKGIPQLQSPPYLHHHLL